MNFDSATTELQPALELDHNQDHMGYNPNLVVSGEALLLPSVSEPAINTLANIPAAAEPVAVSETSEPVESAVGTSPVRPEASWLNERRLIGLGIIVLTLALAILILWKRPMERTPESRKDNTWAAVNPVEFEQDNPLEDRGRYLQPDLYDVPEEQRGMYINQIMAVTSPATMSFEPPKVPEIPSFCIHEEEAQHQIDEFRQRIEELMRK
jgi:hypothetical protein